MELIELLRKRVAESSIPEVSAFLGVEPQELEKELLKSDDGSNCVVEFDAEGCLNLSYCPPEWGKKKGAWDGRDVCLCIPCYKDIPPRVMFVFLTLAMKYRQAIRLEQRNEDSMIARSRNQLSKRFLDTGATWAIWLDSDMLFPFGNAGAYGQLINNNRIGANFLGYSVIERLISWKKTVVGGCYWDRMGQGRLIAAGNQAILNPIPSDTLYAATFCGTGCLAVHRQVYLDIAKKFPETFADNRVGNECGFFTPIQGKDGRMWGEDESFGWRATEAGHPTFIDLGVICGHIGTAVHALPEKGSKL